MDKKERKDKIDSALDEIDACYDAMESRRVLDDDTKKRMRGWVRKHKEILKELKYRGKIRRLKKS